MKFIIFCISFLSVSFCSVSQETLVGAWSLKMGASEVILLATDNYFSYTMYENTTNQFSETWGGTYVYQNGQIVLTIEFNSSDSTQVGNEKKLKANLIGTFLKISNLTFQKLDEGNETPLAGTWQISKRADTSGEMKEITPSVRKTLKILSGTRFQWIAMNTATGQFFGTGGGTYTLEDGVYTEKIGFFSRDLTRVGTSLSFNADVSENEWIHSGNSSAGKPIKEVWSKK